MVWLTDSEKKLRIRLFVSTQYTNVTNTGQTDGRTDRHRTTAMGALSAWLDCSREAKIVVASVMKLSG